MPSSALITEEQQEKHMSKKKTNGDAEATANEEAAEQTFLAKQAESPEQQNVYEFQMSSTETALLAIDDFWKLKLTS
jgi:hypothetical protein